MTREDLGPVLEKLRDNLIGKNVASEVIDQYPDLKFTNVYSFFVPKVASDLIESVMVKLEGSVMGTFQSLQRLNST